MDERIKVMDIARGLAILGTLGTNIWIFAYLGNFDFLLSGNMFQYSWDTMLENFFIFFMNGKFLGLLTILFGMGLEIKRRSYLNKGHERMWPWIYIWGMLLLFIDGLLHYLFVFEFDVLMSYAVSGIIVSILIGFKTKIIKRVAIFLGIIHVIGVVLLAGIMEVIFRVEELLEEITVEMQMMSTIFLSGSYLDQVLYRFEDFWALRSEAIAIIPMNILLFLLGVYIVRSGLFNQTELSKARRKKFMAWGLGLGIPLNALMFLPSISLALIVRYLFAPLMALGYFMLFDWMLEKKPSFFLFNRLSEVGRTALSCYMLQNLLASMIFYGWGLGLGGKLNSLEIIAVWCLLCICMMVFAHLWLKKFPTGPFELIWRWVTALPLKIKRKQKVA